MMTHDAWYIDRVKTCTPQDLAAYQEACDKLPIRFDTTPYHSGPHSVAMFHNALKLADFPTRILETGFCLGHSAAILLTLGASRVVSIENSTRKETLEAAEIMKDYHGARFDLVYGDAQVDPRDLIEQLDKEKFQLMYVDGDHTEEGVWADTQLGVMLGIRWFLFDDYYPMWGPGVQPVIERSGLTPVAILGSMCLCRFL